MAHSQNQSASQAKGVVPQIIANPAAKLPADKADRDLVDSTQGSHELGKHRAAEKAAQQPPAENHVTSRSDQKFPFPTGQISAEKEEADSGATQNEATQNHHANPSRNTFHASERASAQNAAQPARQAHESHASRASPPIKQPNKETNGS